MSLIPDRRNILKKLSISSIDTQFIEITILYKPSTKPTNIKFGKNILFIFKELHFMTNITKLLISISLSVLGIGLSCISYSLPNEIWNGVIFGLGISILTTAIIDIYKHILNSPNIKDQIISMGLLDVDHNETSNSQDDIYKNAKSLKIIFSAGSNTFRTYQDSITESIIKNNCNVQIVLSDNDILKSGMYMSAINETDIAKQIVINIINDISSHNHVGSIELRYSPIPPIGSVEIKDDKYCIVVPYMYKRNSAICYHATYKNTGKNNDIYNKWNNHFDEIWEKSKTILKYPISRT